MGGGRGGGYSSNNKGVHNNSSELAGAFPVTKSGFFGVPGNGKARIVLSDNPKLDGKKFFDIASKGGTVTKVFFENGPKAGQLKGYKATFPNGDFVTFRPSTKTSKNPGVQLTISAGPFKSQKIHFEKKDK